VTLQSLGASLFVFSNSTTTPFTETLPFTASVAVALVVLGYAAARISRRRKKKLQANPN